jgi:hypothetical protein
MARAVGRSDECGTTSQRLIVERKMKEEKREYQLLLDCIVWI